MEEDSDNCFDISGLKEALNCIDLDLTEDQFDFLVWLLYQSTKDVRKMKNDLLADGIPKNNVSLSSIKEEKDDSNIENSHAKASHRESENDDYSGFNDEDGDDEKEEKKDLDMSEDDPPVVSYQKKKTELSVKIQNSEDPGNESYNSEPNMKESQGKGISKYYRRIGKQQGIRIHRATG